MVDAVVAGPEISVLHVADQILREDRIAVPEAIGQVETAAEALLLRAGEIERGAADDGPIEVDAEHHVRRDARSDAGEVVPAVSADRAADDVPASPVAAGELVVIVRLR